MAATIGRPPAARASMSQCSPWRVVATDAARDHARTCNAPSCWGGGRSGLRALRAWQQAGRPALSTDQDSPIVSCQILTGGRQSDRRAGFAPQAALASQRVRRAASR